MWVSWKRFGGLFSHYADVTFAEVVNESHESHAFGRGVSETLMHELWWYVLWNVGKVGNWRWRWRVRSNWSCNCDTNGTRWSRGVFDNFEVGDNGDFIHCGGREMEGGGWAFGGEVLGAR